MTDFVVSVHALNSASVAISTIPFTVVLASGPPGKSSKSIFFRFPLSDVSEKTKKSLEAIAAVG